MPKREVITIGVSRRILWIGGEAYPLQNIARAQTVKVIPRRGRMLWSFLKATLLWLGLGVAAALGLSYAQVADAGSPVLTGVAAVVGALTLLSAIRLIIGLFTRTRYALVIETAGNPRTALMTTDRQQVEELVHRIMDAIDNPSAEFTTKVENYHFGDKIQQFGSNNIGKVTT